MKINIGEGKPGLARFVTGHVWAVKQIWVIETFDKTGREACFIKKMEVQTNPLKT